MKKSEIYIVIYLYIIYMYILIICIYIIYKYVYMYLVMIGMDKDIEQITKLLLSLKDNANSFSQDVAGRRFEVERL